MRDTPTYSFVSLLLLFNLAAFLIYFVTDIHNSFPVMIGIGVLAFFLTYLLDIALHFYYLKHRQLDNYKPRLFMTLIRVAVLAGLFRIATMNR